MSFKELIIFSSKTEIDRMTMIELFAPILQFISINNEFYCESLK